MVLGRYKPVVFLILWWQDRHSEYLIAKEPSRAPSLSFLAATAPPLENLLCYACDARRRLLFLIFRSRGSLIVAPRKRTSPSEQSFCWASQHGSSVNNKVSVQKLLSITKQLSVKTMLWILLKVHLLPTRNMFQITTRGAIWLNASHWDS